jgi:transcriptional regulator with XRE-family HTH domain
MKLADYLTTTSTSHAAFASRIGVSQATVSRYAAGNRIPGPSQMARIVEATDGTVLPNDFYGVRAATPNGFAESGAPIADDQRIHRIKPKPMTPERKTAMARWREENAETTRSYNEYVEKHGLLSERWRRW